MRITGTEDLRVQKTIEAIHRTFWDLIREMDYEKISVKTLCDRAMINKKTFYRYYATLDDLLAEMQGEMSAEYTERVAPFRIPEELNKINREFFLYSEEKGEAYEKITCSGNYKYIRQKMINNVMASTWKDADAVKRLDILKQNILLTYVQAASVEMYRQWVADGKKIPLEEIIEMSTQLLCHGVTGLIGSGTSDDHHGPICEESISNI